MFSKLIATNDAWELTVLRLAAGIMIFPHGLQKTFGLFGGAGFSRTMDYFTKGVGVPAWLALVVIIAELLGGLGLILGALTRIAAFGVLCDMIGAVLTTHLHNGFFMNWGGRQKGEGFEFHILAAGILFVVMLKGAGALSLDRAIARQTE